MSPYHHGTLGPLGEIRFASTAAFLQELTRVFGGSNEQTTAARELESLRQGNRGFARYCADFTRLVAVFKYGEEGLRYSLERGLSTELLNATTIRKCPETETLAQCVQRLKHLEYNIRRTEGLARPR